MSEPATSLDDLCDHFEARCMRGLRPKIEQYLQAVAPQSRRWLLRHLVFIELKFRAALKERISFTEYKNRFPDHEDLLREVFIDASCAFGKLRKQRKKLQTQKASEPTPEPRPQSYAEAEQQLNAQASTQRGKSTNVSTATGKSDPQKRSGHSGFVSPKWWSRSLERTGRYVVRKVLGEGSFGYVYLAHDRELDRRVAIKMPRPERLTDPQDVKSFLSEARLVAQLDHPHIVPVYDVDRTPDGLCYVVSKYIEGSSLAQVAAKAPFSPYEAAQLIGSLADAIHYAHTQGIVHRDLKPANVLIDRQGRTYITDFGLALHERDQSSHAGQVAGTPAYMSPEQVRGESHHLDGRTDIWSLGVMFYELLTRRKPFSTPDREELFNEILHREPKPPRQIDDSIPSRLEKICLRCLAKQVTERYTTGRDVSEDLQRYLRDDPSEGSISSMSMIQPLEEVGVGSLINNRYRLEERWCKNPQGSYYRTSDLRRPEVSLLAWIGRQSVAKNQPQSRGWLARAQQLAGFAHPHIAPKRWYETLADGRPAIVLQAPGGSTLDQLQPLSLDGLCEFVKQIGDALQTIHEAGFVHGELQPGSVLRADRSTFRSEFILLDFGLGELSDPIQDARRTEPMAQGRAGRRLAFSSPEQLQRELPSPLSDVYQFGLLLYYLITGQYPFEGADLTDAILQGRPRRFQEVGWRVHVPREVEDLVLRCLAKSPADRPHSVREVVQHFLVLCSKPASRTAPTENIQFTAYRPQTLLPSQWQRLLAFVHPTQLSGGRDAMREVERQASSLLSAPPYEQHSASGSSNTSSECPLTMVPHAAGVTFSPPSRTFQWDQTVHCEEFALQANSELEGQVVQGRLTIYFGHILLGEVPLSFQVEHPRATRSANFYHVASRGRRFQRVYLACAWEDRAMVEHLQNDAHQLGCQHMQICLKQRSGEQWSQQLATLIHESEAFQLFWSEQAMLSRLMQQEWQYALSLNRNEFIRPVYWQDPLPRDPAHGLPPWALEQYGFQRLPMSVGGGSSIGHSNVRGTVMMGDDPIRETAANPLPPEKPKKFPSTVANTPVRDPRATPSDGDDGFGASVRTPPPKDDPWWTAPPTAGMDEPSELSWPQAPHRIETSEESYDSEKFEKLWEAEDAVPLKKASATTPPEQPLAVPAELQQEAPQLSNKKTVHSQLKPEEPAQKSSDTVRDLPEETKEKIREQADPKLERKRRLAYSDPYMPPPEAFEQDFADRGPRGREEEPEVQSWENQRLRASTIRFTSPPESPAESAPPPELQQEVPTPGFLGWGDDLDEALPSEIMHPSRIQREDSTPPASWHPPSSIPPPSALIETREPPSEMGVQLGSWEDHEEGESSFSLGFDLPSLYGEEQSSIWRFPTKPLFLLAYFLFLTLLILLLILNLTS